MAPHKTKITALNRMKWSASSDLVVFAAEQTKLTDCVKRLVFASRAAGNHLMWGEPADWPHFVQIIPDQQTIDFSISVYQLGN